jgi:hypothetical protein
MRPTPYVASLRVYQPLEAFLPSDQAYWRARFSSDDVVDTAVTEQSLALKRVIKPQPLGTRPDGAHFLEHEGNLYVCPWSTNDRCWIALETFKDSLPPTVARFFLPMGVEEVIASPQDDVMHIQTETWLVPPRWFTLFIPEERIMERVDGQISIRYRTSMGNARKRAARHLMTIRRSFGPSPVTEENEEQGRWLEEFHPRSLVELDYGGLAGYLDQALAEEGGISADTSIEDVLDSLAGLESGDGMVAGIGYQRLVARWRQVAIFEHAT